MRFKITGISPAVGLLAVIYAERSRDNIRIISARKASKHEIKGIVTVEWRDGKYVKILPDGTTRSLATGTSDTPAWSPSCEPAASARSE
jgi:hypothetical protein